MSTIISAPVRFALVKSGLKYPELIMASSESVSDLVGIYSMKDLGLGVFFGEKRVARRSTTLDVLLGSGPPRPPYSSLEVAVGPNGKSTRPTSVSLISESDYLEFLNDEGRAAITSLVRKIYEASGRTDAEHIKYLGEALSSVFAKLKTRSEGRARARAWNATFLRYYVLIIGIGAIGALFYFVYRNFAP